MSKPYFSILTQVGENIIANALAFGLKVDITKMGVGDGNGILPTPNPSQKMLNNEVRREAINTLYTDEKNPSVIIVEQVIPENEGGWWIREVGLYDKDDNLIAVGNCPESYKPKMAEGSGRTQVIRMAIVVKSSDCIELKVDPSTVLATREYVEQFVGDAINEQDEYLKDIPSFERWGNSQSLDNTDALKEAIAWMKGRGVGNLYFPKMYRFMNTIPLETGISYLGNGKSTSGFIIAHNKDAIKVIEGVKYSPEIRDLIVKHEKLNSPAIGICGINANQMRLSNVQVTGFKTGVVTGGASYYSNFERVRVLNSDVGFIFDSGSRGITASDCSTDARLNSFIFNAETDLINNISLLNPKAEKIKSNGVGFLFKAANEKGITSVSVLSGRFDPESIDSGQIFIKTESEKEPDISNIMFIDPTVFNTPVANILVGRNSFEQVSILGYLLGYGNLKATGMFVHDVENLTRAARLRYIHSDTRPRLEVRNRENSLQVGIRAGNVEAIGVLNVNNQNSADEACIAVAESGYKKPFKLGEWYLWFSTTGVFRKKNGVPLSDGDGSPIHI